LGCILSTPLHDLGSVLFPSSCRLCSGPLLRVSTVPVCDDCLARLLPQSMDVCVRCGENLGEEAFFRSGPAECRSCRLAPPQFVRAAAYGTYHDEMRRSLHLLKYERVTSMAKPLGTLMAQAILMLAPVAPPAMLVIAVPLFAGRQRKRGYNQSILLTDIALQAVRTQLPEWDLQVAHSRLIRTRDTESHFRLAPHQRRENLKGAFAVAAKDAVRGQNILLVDDIYTTGATARECSRVLLKAGASSVWVATLARAQVDTFATWQLSAVMEQASTVH
jgi:ComF family protein